MDDKAKLDILVSALLKYHQAENWGGSKRDPRRHIWQPIFCVNEHGPWVATEALMKAGFIEDPVKKLQEKGGA